MGSTLVATFNVVDESGEHTLPTEVHHHIAHDGYELFSITQQEIGSDEQLVVLLHREQLSQLADIAKGH